MYSDSKFLLIKRENYLIEKEPIGEAFSPS